MLFKSLIKETQVQNILTFSRNETCIKVVRSILKNNHIAHHKLPDPEKLTGNTSLVILDSPLIESADILIQACHDKKIPCFLTSTDNTNNLRDIAYDAGCSDYIQLPFNPAIVLSKIKTHINLAKIIRSYTNQTITPDTLESELLASQDTAILCLAAVARVRDHSTGNHILRTQHYVKTLAEHLRFHPDYAEELDNDETIEIFYKTASLHDIGKVAISDSILQKQGKLTPEEYEIMKQHPVHGYKAIRTAELLLAREMKGKAGNFLKIAQHVTLSHHERWDGKGYPQGLKAQAIPIVARLMSVADVYDAIISKRPYKEALEHSTASNIIKKGKGTFFDPNVVDAFIDLEDTFERISYILEDYFPSQSDLSLHSFDECLN